MSSVVFVSQNYIIFVTSDSYLDTIYFFQDGNGKLDYNEFIKMLKQYD